MQASFTSQLSTLVASNNASILSEKNRATTSEALISTTISAAAYSLAYVTALLLSLLILGVIHRIDSIIHQRLFIKAFVVSMHVVIDQERIECNGATLNTPHYKENTSMS